MFTTFASFFANTYGFKAGVGGLTYLGLGVGFFVATIFGAKFADQVYQYVGAFSLNATLSHVLTFRHPACLKERWCWKAGDADSCAVLRLVLYPYWCLVRCRLISPYCDRAPDQSCFVVGTVGRPRRNYTGSCQLLVPGSLHLVRLLMAS